ncbi:nucleoside hydrolase [Lactobacillus mulieris]|uniref:nucleoside hydrolase n=2 Tax=Lactobacillus mulieris TaxID=2508708 RepID=UPI0001B2B115|nr:nucleoside hydrolase [Lactobacillus mulieris]EEU20596.1 hypothetical protein HMPREF0525_01176 [Lactobacillus jensenii 27-2-CHN]EEX23868.1 Inosine-uridine preferring nucleoside hydrolase [Lactobacillus jensenii 115-3-CHN]KAA9366887.1 nucleoside hydrolase [Lactobacillus jensenii]KAA9372776.1 nucleoside hydrolase [Lactobacillus jensenii]MCF1797888.1 nucleoside hydrolase [Lactobacillus mulieris]
MKKVILSLDTGIDDAMALAYTIAKDELDLIGVVGTYGNVYTEQGAKNALALLEMLGKTDIPVYLGNDHAIDQDHFDRMEVSADIHGENGIGQVIIPAATRQVETTSGIDFIIESTQKYGKDLLVIATGPMTDLALVLQKYPAFKDEIGQVVIMGGALTVRGNVSPYAEANINQDPLAAKILFESGTPVIMIGLDVTMKTPIGLTDTQKWRDTQTFVGEKYADIVDYYIHIYDKYSPYLHGGSLHDPAAVCAAIHPEWFTFLPMHLTCETEGPSRGRTIGRLEDLRKEKPNVKVAIDIEADKVSHDICSSLENWFKESK